jgi:putative glutamine amidotransferase
VRAIAAAGVLPVGLPAPAPADAPALVSRLDGLVLSGGPDLAPAASGAREHVELGATEPDS